VQYNDNGIVSGATNFTYNKATSAVSIAGALTLTGGTANGVPYLNASKVVTTGTNLSFANTPGFFDSTLNINSLLGSGLYRGGITVSEDNTSFTLFGGSGYKLIQASGFSTPNELIFYVSNAEAARFNSTANLVLKGGTAGANGVGVTFPAVQVASSDANCLDDYEEGTWVPTQGAGLTVVGTFSSSGTYTKVGRLVTITGSVDGSTSVAAAASGIVCNALPFSSAQQVTATAVNSPFNAGAFCAINVTSFYAITAIGATTAIRFSATYSV
jgi:hypothetical protein